MQRAGLCLRWMGRLLGSVVMSVGVLGGAVVSAVLLVIYVFSRGRKAGKPLTMLRASNRFVRRVWESYP